MANASGSTYIHYGIDAYIVNDDVGMCSLACMQARSSSMAQHLAPVPGVLYLKCQGDGDPTV